MSDIPPSSGSTSALQEEIQTLRAENARLHREQTVSDKQEAIEDQYQRSQDRFRTVFENSPLGQKIITPDLIIRQANQALATMLGVGRPEEVVGRRILEFAHPDHRQGWHELQRNLWNHKTPSYALETCLVRPDGSSFWCRVTAVLFHDDGGELGYTTLEDIAERKKMEIAHKRLYDAQETILHLVAHDLKSPINNIQMLTEMLQRDAAIQHQLAPRAQEDVQQLLTMIEQACAKADILLKDVLYLGQMEASRLEKHRTDLGAFLHEHLDVFRVAALENEVELKLDLPQSVVYADIHPDKFGRILDNLLTNALHFTPAGGEISVGLQELDGRVRLMVRDTGLGIPAELQPHVFDKFSAAAHPGLYGDTTTGLGLFITKQIVELHDGKIWLESREHEGTTFYIDLT